MKKIYVNNWLSKLTMLCFFLAMSCPAFSQARRFYRVDFRPPSVIFNSGFASWGGDDFLLRHLSGQSLRNHTSAFISMTDNLGTAQSIAYGDYYLNPSSQNQNIYIYEIISDNNMYSADIYLQNLQYNQNNQNLSEAAIATRRFIARLNEWDALNSIPAAHIISARSYQYIRGTNIQAAHIEHISTETNLAADLSSGNPPSQTVYPPYGSAPRQSLVNSILGGFFRSFVLPLGWCVSASQYSRGKFSGRAASYNGSPNWMPKTAENFSVRPNSIDGNDASDDFYLCGDLLSLDISRVKKSMDVPAFVNYILL